MTIHRELGIEYKMPVAKNEGDYGRSVNTEKEEDDDDDDIRDNVDYGTYED